MRIAVVGAGPWALETHLPRPPRPRGRRGGRRMDPATGGGRRSAVPRFESVEAMLDATDAVSLAVPPAAQAAIALQAVRAGKHVILDKPIAGSRAGRRARRGRRRGGRRIHRHVHPPLRPETRAFLDARGPGVRGRSGRWLSVPCWAVATPRRSGARTVARCWTSARTSSISWTPHSARSPRSSTRAWSPTTCGTSRSPTRRAPTSAIQMSLCVPARPTVTEFAVHGPSGVVVTDRPVDVVGGLLHDTRRRVPRVGA